MFFFLFFAGLASLFFSFLFELFVLVLISPLRNAAAVAAPAEFLPKNFEYVQAEHHGVEHNKHFDIKNKVIICHWWENVVVCLPEVAYLNPFASTMKPAAVGPTKLPMYKEKVHMPWGGKTGGKYLKSCFSRGSPQNSDTKN